MYLLHVYACICFICLLGLLVEDQVKQGLLVEDQLICAFPELLCYLSPPDCKPSSEPAHTVPPISYYDSPFLILSAHFACK